MPGGIYQRVASRGFPSNVAAGQTGAASLEDQGGPTDPIHGQALTTAAPVLTTKPGFAQEAPSIQPVPVLPSAFGLPGADLSTYDATPRTHAGPVPGHAGSYDSPDLLVVRVNSGEVHGEDFGALDRHVTVHGVLGRDPSPDQWDIFTAHNPGLSVQNPVDGQLRQAGGRDQVQGYGLLNDRYGFDAGHRERHVTRAPLPRAYLDPGERVWIIPQASGNFVPSDTVQGPAVWAGGWAAESVNATAPTAYAPPPDPATSASGPVGAPASAGWWG